MMMPITSHHVISAYTSATRAMHLSTSVPDQIISATLFFVLFLTNGF